MKEFLNGTLAALVFWNWIGIFAVQCSSTPPDPPKPAPAPSASVSDAASLYAPRLPDLPDPPELGGGAMQSPCACYTLEPKK